MRGVASARPPQDMKEARQRLRWQAPVARAPQGGIGRVRQTPEGPRLSARMSLGFSAAVRPSRPLATPNFTFCPSPMSARSRALRANLPQPVGVRASHGVCTRNPQPEAPTPMPTSDPSVPPKPRPRPEPGPRLREAVDELIADLERAHTRFRTLEREMADAKAHEAALRATLDGTLKLFPMAERYNYSRRINRLDQTYSRPPEGKRQRVPDPDSRVEAIRHYLATLNADSFRVADLTLWLERQGYALRPRYAANTLNFMAKQGYVTRIAHGRYAINRLQPLLLEMQFKILDAEVRRIP